MSKTRKSKKDVFWNFRDVLCNFRNGFNHAKKNRPNVLRYHGVGSSRKNVFASLLHGMSPTELQGKMFAFFCFKLLVHWAIVGWVKSCWVLQATIFRKTLRRNFFRKKTKSGKDCGTADRTLRPRSRNWTTPNTFFGHLVSEFWKWT